MTDPYIYELLQTILAKVVNLEKQQLLLLLGYEPGKMTGRFCLVAPNAVKTLSGHEVVDSPENVEIKLDES